jgi:transposase InsO family protein
LWKAHNRAWPEEPVARCTVERLMRVLGLQGMPNARSARTARPGTAARVLSAGSPGAGLPRSGTESALGRPHHLRRHLGRIRLRRCRDGPVLAPCRGVACREQLAYRSRSGCFRARALECVSRESSDRRAQSQFGSRVSVFSYSLHGASC